MTIFFWYLPPIVARRMTTTRGNSSRCATWRSSSTGWRCPWWSHSSRLWRWPGKNIWVWDSDQARSGHLPVSATCLTDSAWAGWPPPSCPRVCCSSETHHKHFSPQSSNHLTWNWACRGLAISLLKADIFLSGAWGPPWEWALRDLWCDLWWARPRRRHAAPGSPLLFLSSGTRSSWRLWLRDLVLTL